VKKITKRQLRIILKIIIIVFVIIGVIAQQFIGFLSGRGYSAFLYFTTQSNIILAITALILLIYDIKGIKNPPALVSFHHIAISAILLTFIVFSLFLGPFIPSVSYFYSPGNLTLHNLVPILGLVNYLLEEDKMPPKYVRSLALISGLTYLIATYILYFSGANFGLYEFPYFFLNFKELGWLTLDFANMRFGIIYWWIIIIIFLYGISALTYNIKQKSTSNPKLALNVFIFLFALAVLFTTLNVIIKLTVGVPINETTIKIFIA